MQLKNQNVLITFLFKEGAGPVFTLEMARGLALNGCNVTAILSSKIANRDQWEKEQLLKEIIYIDTGTRNNAIQATAFWFFCGRTRLKDKLKDEIFDIAISTFYHPWALSLLNCAQIAKKIVLCHDPIHHSGVSRLESFLTTKYIKAADEVVVLTKSFIPIVNERFGFSENKIIFMPHGRMSEYRKSDVYTPMNKIGTVNFLFFGRISPYKGLKTLAEAYRMIIMKNKNVTLRIAGSGNFDELKEYYSGLENCTVDNRYIADDEIDNYFLKENTILLLPYIDASQSGVIPIAFEYGTPLIASDTGGLKEQLNEGKIGLFSVAGCAHSLAEKMQEYINEPQKMEEQAMLMRNYKESLNWEHVTRCILEK